MDAKTYKMNRISQKSLILAMFETVNDSQIEHVAAKLHSTPDAVREKMDDTVKSLSRPKKSKPSKQTLDNQENIKLVVAEINARGGEFTAAELADLTTDKDGNVMTSKRIGSLLKQAHDRGLIAVSPEPWPVRHYGPLGFEFKKKPQRATKQQDNEDSDESTDNDEQ